MCLGLYWSRTFSVIYRATRENTFLLFLEPVRSFNFKGRVGQTHNSFARKSYVVLKWDAVLCWRISSHFTWGCAKIQAFYASRNTPKECRTWPGGILVFQTLTFIRKRQDCAHTGVGCELHRLRKPETSNWTFFLLQLNWKKILLDIFPWPICACLEMNNLWSVPEITAGPLLSKFSKYSFSVHGHTYYGIQIQ